MPYNKVSSNGIGMVGTITRPANTNTYTAGDVIGTAATTTITLTGTDDTLAGCHYIIMGASLRIDLNAVPASMTSFKLHLYSSAPTTTVDEDTFNLVAGDRDKYLGYIQFDGMEDLGDTIYKTVENINMKRKFATGSTTIYGVLQAIGALVGAASTVHTVKLHCVQA